ncbi:hypothetical protein [Aureispira anguillae]|uniref:Uncharacterized protein n=1 Tax=Aureispira anguillae TaxID=2864201 RepID=A0A915YHJ5_9BACT|nr:hypothetical protein [Aureispira anguillae]BDS13310.1 hypothetical protein AsAng_0040450 [Aureispira anguillae]
MRRELENIEYIERYLENTLSRADRYKFEQYMQQDAAFKQTVELQRQIIAQLKEEAFLMDVTTQHQHFIQQESKSIFRFIWVIPPVLLILGVLTGWWYFASTPHSEVSTIIESPAVSIESSPIQDKTALVAQTKAFKTSFVSKKVNARKGAVIQLKHSNSVLHIPKNAVVDQAGNPVKGTYDLQYRELRDRAQMAFSGWPMNGKKGEKAQGFNSVGMLEVRAFKEGETLRIAPNKNMTLDYEVNKRMSNLDLYHLEDSTKTWTSTTDNRLQLPKRGAYTESFDSIRYKNDVAAYEEKFKKPKPNEATLDGSTWNASTTLIPEKMKKLEEEEKPDPNKYIVKHYDNPRLIKELRLNSFGVYNCSQMYQVENQIAVSAQYTDLQKTIINNARTLSIIDMNYNAAYSFKPEQFICNGAANNVFLLWSNDGKLYSFVKRSTVKMSTGNYSFQMEDLSQKVKNTNDLKRYLKFVDKKTKETVTRIQ